MKVTIVSNNQNILSEFEEKLKISLNLVSKDTMLTDILKENTDLLFCPDLKVPIKKLKKLHIKMPNLKIVFNAVCTKLEDLVAEGINESILIGMNLLPTFVNRPLAEVTTQAKGNSQVLMKLGWEVKNVASRIGLVTPRVIVMIINEAYFTVQEGTATKEDIDVGMKLGTNYPKGPFEWANLIGLKNIYKTLDALYEDTKEGRYKICPLLKTEMQGIS
ncbi:3-hydroxyacyl-CoA dehydrogenase family protein [Bacteroidia bacterium]|nr:3-hydroxyacyl-CoA dehydrogenase family protein [Bacteroidia bacterium]